MKHAEADSGEHGERACCYEEECGRGGVIHEKSGGRTEGASEGEPGKEKIKAPEHFENEGDGGDEEKKDKADIFERKLRLGRSDEKWREEKSEGGEQDKEEQKIPTYECSGRGHMFNRRIGIFFEGENKPGFADKKKKGTKQKESYDPRSHKQ